MTYAGCCSLVAIGFGTLGFDLLAEEEKKQFTGVGFFL